jgi:hypothetical protein
MQIDPRFRVGSVWRRRTLSLQYFTRKREHKCTYLTNDAFEPTVTLPATRSSAGAEGVAHRFSREVGAPRYGGLCPRSSDFQPNRIDKAKGIQ